MPKVRQGELFTATSHPRLRNHAKQLEHGGDVRAGRRKLARPVDPKRPLHLVFRSERAKGAWSLLRPETNRAVQRILDRAAHANGVRIYERANSGNHLHLVVRAKTRQGFQNFARTAGALIARAVTGAKKGNPIGKFWEKLVYSRVVEWGRAFRMARRYVVINALEGQGVWGLRKRKPPPSGSSRMLRI